MSWVIIIWSMVASACLTLAALRLLVWCKKRTVWAHLLFSVTAMATAAMAYVELWMMRAETPGQFAVALRWLHVPAWVIILALIAFVRIHLRAGRPWLAWTIYALRTISLLLNFLVGQNLNYREVTHLRHIPFLGESVSVGAGVSNPWMIVGQLSLALFVVFVTDAAITLWRRGDRRQALVMGGSIVFFALVVSVQSVLVLWEIIHWPLTPSLFYLGIVVAMSYEMSRNVLRAAQLAEELCESELRMTLAAEAAGFGVWIWSIARNQIWGSDRYLRLFGFAPDEALSFEKVIERIHPDDRGMVERELRRALTDKSDYAGEYRVVCADGDERWITVRGRYYPDENGTLGRILGAAIEITERKRAEEALRESEARYRGIFDGAIEGIFRASLQGKIMVANSAAATMFGYDSVENFSRGVGDLANQVWADPDERSRFIRLLEEQGTVRAYECRFLRKDGTKIWVSLNSRAVRGPDGQVVYLESFIEDITPQREAEDSLRTAYAEIKELKERLDVENLYLREKIRGDDEHGAIVGQSPALQKVLSQIEQVAPTDSHVLITGETGTGKELVAQAIHATSKRKERLMVTVNCATLPSSLIESELFGREKGAYTGALSRQIGRFELADNGTIFLDEIGEISMELQGKLLRVLQEGEFERLGNPKTIRVDVRVIAATNRNLAEAVHQGTFRKDLYYRLNVFPIEVPPLRARMEDVPLLLWAFIDEFGMKMGKKIDSVPQKTMDFLRGYAWPGNVRELRNTIERAMILSLGDRLEVQLPVHSKMEDSTMHTMEETEHRLILDALEKTGRRIKGSHGAAELLGLKPSTLYSKMQKLGIPHRRQKDEISP